MLKPITFNHVQAALDTITPPDEVGFLVGDVLSLHFYPRDVWERAVVRLPADDEWRAQRVVMEPAPQVIDEALKQLFGGDVSAVLSFDVNLEEGVYAVVMDVAIPFNRYDRAYAERRIGRVLR